jgi:hypothetical protein
MRSKAPSAIWGPNSNEVLFGIARRTARRHRRDWAALGPWRMIHISPSVLDGGESCRARVGSWRYKRHHTHAQRKETDCIFPVSLPNAVPPRTIRTEVSTTLMLVQAVRTEHDPDDSAKHARGSQSTQR